MPKSELAHLADVSPHTFCRWLTGHREELHRLGISPKAHIIPSIGARYICEQYGIDL